jgi:hypothetical protein
MKKIRVSHPVLCRIVRWGTLVVVCQCPARAKVLFYTGMTPLRINMSIAASMPRL